jgi:hypothetical protein
MVIITINSGRVLSTTTVCRAINHFPGKNRWTTTIRMFRFQFACFVYFGFVTIIIFFKKIY